MKILLVNKYLFPKGGAETYILKLGQYLTEKGHEVQYFGMDHPQRCMGNRIGAYTREMEFHQRNVFAKISYLPSIIYSREAYQKMSAVLRDFQPDIVHLNNFHFQLTPSILVAIQSYRKKHDPSMKVVMTAHDYQLICPNHLLYRPEEGKICERCLVGSFSHCVQGKCIHNSLGRSLVGTLEAYYWNRRNIYEELDTIICPSRFMKSKLDRNPVLSAKTTVLYNFANDISGTDSQENMADEIAGDETEGIGGNPMDRSAVIQSDVGEYVLYFGRYSVEKGLHTLIHACRALPEIPFLFAGSGPMEQELEGMENVHNLGFLKGEALYRLIRGAKFSVCPSVWHENCPFSVIESQMAGTPVLASDRGGIPELLQDGVTGRLFEAGNVRSLTEAIRTMWEEESLTRFYRENCKKTKFMSLETYYDQLMLLYENTNRISDE